MIVIALVLVVLLIVSLTGKKDRGRRERISERKDETESRPQKEEAPLHSRKEEREKLIPDPFEEEEAEEMEYIVEEDQGDTSEEEPASKEEDDFFDTIDLSFEDEEEEPEHETAEPEPKAPIRQLHPRPSSEEKREDGDDFEIFDL